MRATIVNLDFVAALLHGRRSRMAEGERLRTLCQCRTIAEFGHQVIGETAVRSAVELEVRLVQRLAAETDSLATYLSGSAADLAQWLAARFQLENLKLLVRRFFTHVPPDDVRPHLLKVPGGLKLPVDALLKADSLPAFLSAMPSGPLRRQLVWAMDLYREQQRSFFYEAALDRAYLGEMVRYTERLPDQEREWVRPFVSAEVDAFHLVLATRGKLLYGLEPESLLPLQVRGTRISRDRFAAMLAGTDPAAMARQALRGWTEELPGSAEDTETQADTDPGIWERLAWTRVWRQADRAFRRSHMGLATVIAYVALRRLEVANLITVLQGIRAGLAASALEARLIPLHRREVSRV